MARVERAALRAGMVLLQDVLDAAGRVILSADHELNDGDLKRLQTWGVAWVEIRGDAPVELSEEEEERIRARFLHVDLEHPGAAAILAAARARASAAGAGS